MEVLTDENSQNGYYEDSHSRSEFNGMRTTGFNDDGSRSAFQDESSRQSVASDVDSDSLASVIKRLLFQAAVEQTNPIFNGPGAERDSAFPIPKLTSLQKDRIKRAEKFAMEQNIKTVLVKQTITHQTQQMFSFQTSVQKQQALALMCRVYVGSINFEIREDTVRQAFMPFGPIRLCQLSWDPVLQKHKGFAFVEYEIPEAASLALDQMNNALLGGRSIKCGRPSNMPQAMPLIDVVMQEASKYNRIYVASIHTDITDNDLQSVFEAFGKIVSCKIAFDPTRSSKHRGFGFIEYETKQACEDAIAAMNLFDLGGQFIRVGKAVTPPGMYVALGPVVQSTLPTETAVAAAAITARINAMEAVKEVAAVVSSRPSVPIPSVAPPKVDVPPPGVAIPVAVGAPGVAIPVALGAAPTIVPLAAPSALSSFDSNGYPASIPPPGVATLPSFGLGGLSAPSSAYPPLPPTGSFSQVFPNYVVPPQLSAQQQPQQPHYAHQPSAPPQPVAVPAPEMVVAQALKGQAKLTDAQKKLMEDDQSSSLAQQEEMKISGSAARHIVMQRLMRHSENKVMVLRNMVDASEVDEDLEGEVTDECGRYGQVDKVIIYQERQSDDDGADIVVKIFVLFERQQEMEAAISALNGRFFGGRQVSAQPYDQALFDSGDLTG